MRGWTTIVSVCALASGTTLAMSGCGGSEPEPESAANVVPTQSTYPAATYAPAPSTAPVASAPPAASSAPPNMIEPALQQPAIAVLNEIAGREAPGAKPVGETRVGMIGTNQSLEQAVAMRPGKCYTVVAVGLPPVTELNVQLLPATTVPGMNAVLAQDQTVGPQAILGQAPNCFKWALPVEGSVRVVTTVASGAGLVASQVYEK